MTTRSVNVIVEDFLNQIGWGKYQNIMALQCGLAWTTTQMWEVLIGLLLGLVADDWNLSIQMEGYLATSMQLGIMMGSYIWCYLSDRFGRMFSFKKSAVLLTLTSFLLIFSPEYYSFLVFLFFMGFSIGGELTVGGAVFSEFCPPKDINKLASLSFTWGVGGVFAALIGIFCTEQNFLPITSWRIMIAIAFLYEFCIMCFRFKMDETPFYLGCSGNIDKAEKIIEKIAKTNNYNLQKPLVLQTHIEYGENNKKSILGLLKLLFSEKYTKNSIFFAFIYFFLASGYTNMLYFMPLFLDGYSLTERYLIIMLQQMCAIPGTIVSSYLCKSSLGSKHTLSIGILFSAIFCILFYMANEFATILTFTSLLILVIMLAYGTLYMITPESYPIEIKSTGCGWSNACGRTGGLLTPIATGWLLSMNNGKPIVLALCSLYFLISGISSFFIQESKMLNKGSLFIYEKIDISMQPN
ncbi:naiP_8 [Blepharisma stoltei]|uniref:Major facilitator superfamily (MFS) profile domain-containing protein n=1 Tax=Blepharisma stoltei TaxID=1481888 RepID=A0AAU9JHJ4_9CILI|nr:unnamed protein product [Blepharisma stoltei]